MKISNLSILALGLLLAIVAGLIGGCENPADAELSEVVFVMTLPGYDYGVYLDGNFIGNLDSGGKTIRKDISAGNHTYHFTENDLDLKSIDYNFNIGSLQVLTIRIVPDGDGTITIVWEGEI